MFDELIQKLLTDRYISLETTPPKKPTISTIIDEISQFNLDKKVDAFTTTDNPLAKLKYSAILGAIKVQNAFNKPVIATISMRDRNKIALQSDLLGANDFDIRAFLALTGDSPRASDQPNSKGVFEGDSTLMLDIIKCFNAGIDYAGREFKTKPKPIYPFAVSNAYAKNNQTIIKKMSKKLRHGAQGIITQPIFDIDTLRILISNMNEAKSLLGNHNSELIIGLFPITRLKTAQFLSAHVPGIFVPRSWEDALFSASKISVEEEYKVGMALSKGLYEEVMKIHPKVHIMTANKFNVAHDLIS